MVPQNYLAYEMLIAKVHMAIQHMEGWQRINSEAKFNKNTVQCVSYDQVKMILLCKYICDTLHE